MPGLSEFYYGLEAAFLPAIAYLQWRLGRASLAKSGAASPGDTAARALAVSAACFVFPDALLLVIGRSDLLATWARLAGPLALASMLFVLYRSVRWTAVVRAVFWLALPALVLVR